jgi:hypothetical protein
MKSYLPPPYSLLSLSQSLFCQNQRERGREKNKEMERERKEEERGDS